jgi:hypothetical protein
MHAPSQSTTLGHADARVETASSARGSWLPWVGLGLLGVASALVFWLFEALPFQDLPAHAGLISMRHRFAESAFEQRYFVLAPHLGPYSLFRFVGEELVQLVGPLSTVRLLGTLPMLATPMALLFARRRLYGETSPTMGFMGIALSFGLMTLLGFASYLLGVAVMLIALTLWLDLLAASDNGESTAKKELIVAATAAVLFVAHGHAFVLFLLLAGISALSVGDRGARLLRGRALLPAVALAGWVAWHERASQVPAGSVRVMPDGMQPHFQSAYDKFTLLITPALMTRTGIDFITSCLIWVLVAACTFATVRELRQSRGMTDGLAQRRHSRALLVCALAIALTFLALPHAIGWFGFVDGRLVPLVLFLCLMGVRREALGPFLGNALDRGAPALASAMAAVALVASYRFQAEARGYREVLGAVPSNSRLLNLPLDPNSDIFTAHPFVHYDKLVLAEKPVVVSDVWFHQGTALYPTAENPALRLPSSYSESDLRWIDWPAYHLEDWDYVLIRTRPEAAAPSTPPALALAEHRGGWWLYRSAPHPSAN